jgi:hypothetical protein
MAHTIEQFSSEVHKVLAANPGPAGREKVRRLLEDVLKDEAFIATHLGDDQPERRVLYEDRELGFLILGHVHHNARRTKPHDHGSTWAIYGQAVGLTHMDEWEIVEPATAERPGKVRRARSYELTPGDARVFNEGVVHSPWRDVPGKQVRIEGGHIERAGRPAYEPA